MQMDASFLSSLEALSGLRLEEDERPQVQMQLRRVAELFLTLDAPELDDLPPEKQDGCPLREDKAAVFEAVDAIVQHAPRQQSGCFVVPKAVE